MRVQTSLVCAVMCTVLSSINSLATVSSNVDAVKWADSYGAGYKQAVEEKKELFVFFEPTKPSKENVEFVETTLKDANVLKDLESRVAVKLSTEQKIEEGEKAKPLSQNAWFRNEALSTVGGWVVISFVKNAKGDLKNSYAFQPASGPNSFKTWEAKNVDGVLTGRITQELPGVPGAAVATSSGTAQVSGGGNGELARLNAARARAGLHALMHDENLYQVAYQRAAVMARYNSMNHNIGGGAPSWQQFGARYEGLGNSPEGACYGTWRGNYGITYVGTACVGNMCVNIYR